MYAPGLGNADKGRTYALPGGRPPATIRDEVRTVFVAVPRTLPDGPGRRGERR